MDDIEHDYDEQDIKITQQAELLNKWYSCR